MSKYRLIKNAPNQKFFIKYIQEYNSYTKRVYILSEGNDIGTRREIDTIINYSYSDIPDVPNCLPNLVLKMAVKLGWVEKLSLLDRWCEWGTE